MPDSVQLRPAEARDSSELILFADAATRRFITWVWGEMVEHGQSGLELGRQLLETDGSSVNHISHWTVAESGGRVLGGMNSYVSPPTSTPDNPAIAAVVKPLNELKDLAEGSWYISTVAVHAEGRGQGIGTTLLDLAEQKAAVAGCSLVTLMAGSFNVDALRLYERHGYSEWDRRPFVPFPARTPKAPGSFWSKSSTSELVRLGQPPSASLREMELVLEQAPKLLASLLLAGLAIVPWLLLMLLGPQVSRRWPLGVSHRPLMVASLAFLVVWTVVLLGLLPRPLGVTTGANLDAVSTVVSNTAVSSGVVSVGVLVLLAIRQLFGRVMRFGSPSVQSVARYAGWAASLLLVLVLCGAMAMLPAISSNDLTGNVTTDALFRILGGVGSLAVIGLTVWQLIPIVQGATGAPNELRDSTDAGSNSE